jgi:hypothetical protein
LAGKDFVDFGDTKIAIGCGFTKGKSDRQPAFIALALKKGHTVHSIILRTKPFRRDGSMLGRLQSPFIPFILLTGRKELLRTQKDSHILCTRRCQM